MFLQLKDDIEISVTPFNVITLIEGVKMRDPRNTLSMKIENTLSMKIEKTLTMKIEKNLLHENRKKNCP